MECFPQFKKSFFCYLVTGSFDEQCSFERYKVCLFSQKCKHINEKSFGQNQVRFQLKLPLTLKNFTNLYVPMFNIIKP